MWYRCSDMHTGGYRKGDHEDVLIPAADEGAAIERFMTEFGHNPGHQSCPCCGQDYAIIEYGSLTDVPFDLCPGMLVLPAV